MPFETTRRAVLLGLGAALACAGRPAFAQTATDQVIEQLQSQGYRRVRVSRTLLGRVRIVATGPAGRREIVLNPATGAILRDYIDRDGDSRGRSNGSNSGKGGGHDDDDDYDDDDYGDDDDHDDDRDDDDNDNSGSGSGNSGKGSGNSGSGKSGGDDGGDDD